MADRIEVTSTNLKSLLHRADGRVEIEFRRSHSVYITEDVVSKEVFQAWLIDGSVGTYFKQHIEPVYRPRVKQPEDDADPGADLEATPAERPVRLTEEQILVQTIAVYINRWIGEWGKAVLDFTNGMDRTAHVAILIRDEALPHAQKLVLEAIAKKDERLADGGRICFRLE